MSKPFPHSKMPYDTPAERPMSMIFDTGLDYDHEESPLTVQVHSTGEVHLIGDPMDHPIKAFTREDAGMLRCTSRLFAWLAEVVEAQEKEDEQQPRPTEAAAPKTTDMRTWLNK